MAHKKWKEIKQQPSLLPGPAVPGCSLVYFHFLWAILCPQAVALSELTLVSSSFVFDFCLFMSPIYRYFSAAQSVITCDKGSRLKNMKCLLKDAAPTPSIVEKPEASFTINASNN